MKKKGGVFLPSLVLALAAHALLFYLFSRLLTPVSVRVVSGVDLVEVQLSGGTGGTGGAGGPGAGSPARPRVVRKAALPAPALSPAPAPSPVPVPQAPENPATSYTDSAAVSGPAEPGAATVGSGPAGTGGPGSGGAGAGAGSSGSGTGGFGGTADGFGAGAGMVIADIDPVPIRAIAVSYPASAKRLGQQGLVKIQADIDGTGVVTTERISGSSGFGALDNAALDAVRQAQFMPAMKNGRPVASRIIIPIRFRLTQN